MKRRIACLLAAVLCLLAELPASAVQGGLVFERENNPYGDYFNAYCVLDDTLWIVGWEGLYAYDTQTGITEAYPWREEDRAALKTTFQEDGTTTYNRMIKLFVWNGALYGLRQEDRNVDGLTATVKVCFSRLEIRDGRAAFEDVEAIDFDDLTDGDGYVFVQRVLAAGEKICVAAEDFSGLNLAFYAMDGSGKAAVPDMNALNEYGLACNVFSYDGKIVLPYDGYDMVKKEMNTLLVSVDPDTMAISEMMTLPGMVSGLTEEPEGGRLLYAQGGQLHAADAAKGSDEVLVSFPFNLFGNAEAYCTAGGAYISECFDGVIVRDIYSAGENDSQLVIAEWFITDAMEKTALAYSGEHPDIDIVRKDAYHVIDDLMTRSPDVDIYVLESCYDNGVLKNVLERGWAMELDSAPIEAYVSGLYPALSEAFTLNGKVIAVPLEASSRGLSIGAGALKELGLTMDDIPTNWPGLLDFLSSLDENTPAAVFDDYNSGEAIKKSLLMVILEDYFIELQQGTLNGFDTPEFRAILEAFERIDFEALAECGTNARQNGYRAPLLNMYAMTDIGPQIYEEKLQNFYDYPLIPSISADLPARMALDCAVAVVNPFSNHIAAATELLERAVSLVPETDRAMLSPNLSEPIPDKARIKEESQVLERKIQECQSLIEELDEDSDEWEAAEAQLEMLLDDYARVETRCWIISPDTLSWYRAHDDAVTLKTDLGQGNYSSYAIASDYVGQGQTIDELIGELEHQFMMELLEDR